MYSYNAYDDNGLGNNGVKVFLNYFDGIPDTNILSTIVSKEVTVQMKLLLKRDEVTKEKAMNELVSLIKDMEYDELVPLVWSQFYPKIALSESKNIRILAHEFTTLLIKLYGKKTAKFLKDFVPTLLSGLYDVDQLVIKSTSTFLVDVFGEKVSSLWKIFNEQITKYITECIVVETPETLSDDRFVSKEEVESRYTRCTVAAVGLLVHMINVSDGDFHAILTCEKTWVFSKDSQRIFKAQLTLISCLFAHDLMTDEIFSLCSVKLMKSLSQFSAKNKLALAPLFVPILEVSSALLRYGSVDTKHLMSFLKLGGTEPAYFKALGPVLKEINDDTIWEFNLEEELNRKPGRFGTKLLEACISSYLASLDTTWPVISKLLERKRFPSSVLMAIAPYVSEFEISGEGEYFANLIDLSFYAKQMQDSMCEYLLENVDEPCCFDGLSLYVKKHIINEHVKEYLSQLGGFLDDDFLKPIEIMQWYSTGDIDDELFIEIFEGFLTKALVIESKELMNTVVSSVDKYNHSELLLPLVQDHVNDFYNGYNFETDFNGKLLTYEIFLDLYARAKETGQLDKFSEYASKSIFFNQLVKETDYLEHAHLEDVQLDYSDEEVLEKVVDICISQVRRGQKTENDPRVLSAMANRDLLSFVGEMGADIDSRLPGAFLMTNKVGVFNADTARELIRLGVFINKLPELPVEAQLFLAVVQEIVSDYELLKSIPLSEWEVSTNVYHRQYDFVTIMKDIINDLVTDELIMQMVTPTETVLDYYYMRILQKILTNSADYVSQSQFADIPLDRYLQRQLRSPSLLHNVLLQSSTKFNLDRIKNMLASELIGVRESELTTKTFKIVYLLTGLLDGGSPFAPQRINMVIQSLNKWQDSDLAYEPEFGVMRACMVSFVSALMVSDFDKNESFLEMAERLAQDSLGMLLLPETDDLILREPVLKLLNNLPNRNEEMYNDVLEIIFQDKIEASFAVPFYREMASFVNKVPIKLLKTFFNKFVEHFTSSKNILAQRLLVHLIRRLVLINQQDFLIKYELKRTKLDEENDEDVLENTLPFLDLLSSPPHEYLEYEDPQVFISYLWCWYLVFTFFENISYNLRQKYIDQLKDRDLINLLLNFISEQIDVNDSEFNVSSDEILKYSALDNVSMDVQSEPKKLLVHLNYVVYNNVGSLTQAWFLNIKNKSIASKIEKFTSSTISPILIGQELDKVAEKIPSLTANDDNLTIKINKITSEIKASYLIDEQKLEISIKLPQQYPLLNVVVTGVSRVGLNEQQWKTWIMSTQRVITSMNGSVVDSLELFTKNVNLHFSGFEDCAICYSILHAVDRRLPSKTCPTCNYKFHGACLYKWFRSSGNNTCPLCRSEIPFRK